MDALVALDHLVLTARALLAFAAVVLVPLALPLAAIRRDTEPNFVLPLRPALVALAGIALAASLLLPAGPTAALLSSVWLLVCIRIAFFGVRRFFGRPRLRLEEIAIDVACAELAIGALWAFVYRLDGGLFGFAGTQALLTALHFHYAGFGATLLAGLTGRILTSGARRAIYRVAATGITAGTMTLAVGISTTHTVEIVAAWGLAACVAIFGVLLVSLAVARPCGSVTTSLGARVALASSGIAAISAMVPAVRFAGVGFAGLDGTSFRHMLLAHGFVNALGFVSAGLSAFRILRPASRWSIGIPWSRIAAQGKVGPRFFEDAGLVDADRDPQPRGLADDFRELDASCHDDVRAFYEETRDHTLVVRPDWRPGFRLAGRLWHAFARRFGQLTLPIDDGSTGPAVTSRIIALRDGEDGRTSVRAWIRTYANADGSEGRAIYVAAYSTHIRRARRYMNIAFPLPGGNMTSILRVEPLGRSGGVRLTTLPLGDVEGDEGVWAVVRGRAARLPLNETIDVWSANADPSWAATLSPPPSVDRGTCTVLATHDMWLFGLRYLRLTYFVARRSRGAELAPGSHRVEA